MKAIGHCASCLETHTVKSMRECHICGQTFCKACVAIGDTCFQTCHELDSDLDLEP